MKRNLMKSNNNNYYCTDRWFSCRLNSQIKQQVLVPAYTLSKSPKRNNINLFAPNTLDLPQLIIAALWQVKIIGCKIQYADINTSYKKWYVMPQDTLFSPILLKRGHIFTPAAEMGRGSFFTSGSKGSLSEGKVTFPPAESLSFHLVTF